MDFALTTSATDGRKPSPNLPPIEETMDPSNKVLLECPLRFHLLRFPDPRNKVL